MKEVSERKWFVPVAVALCALMAAACNTVAGAGEDVSAAGSAVTDAAQDTEREMRN